MRTKTFRSREKNANIGINKGHNALAPRYFGTLIVLENPLIAYALRIVSKIATRVYSTIYSEVILCGLPFMKIRH